MAADRLRYIGVAIAKGIDCDSGHHIEVAAPLGIVEIAALAAGDHKVRAAVDLQNILLISSDELIGNAHERAPSTALGTDGRRKVYHTAQNCRTAEPPREHALP